VFRRGEGRDTPLLDPRVTLALVTGEDLPHPRRFAPGDVPALAAFLVQRFGLETPGTL
jgi:hypothetical protein